MHARWLRLRTHIYIIYYFLLFHSNNCCENAVHCYVLLVYCLSCGFLHCQEKYRYTNIRLQPLLPQLCNSLSVNLLKPTGDTMHQQVWHSTIVRSAHTVFTCFVFICEQTATCATYIINWLVFITEMKSVYCAVRTGSLNKAVCALSLRALLSCN